MNSWSSLKLWIDENILLQLLSTETVLAGNLLFETGKLSSQINMDDIVCSIYK